MHGMPVIWKARQLQISRSDHVICHYRGNIVGGKRIKLIGLVGQNRTPFQNMTDEEEARMKAELEAIHFLIVVISFNPHVMNVTEYLQKWSVLPGRHVGKI